MDDLKKIFQKMHEGQRELCQTVIADMETDGNDRRIKNMRNLIVEIDGKIKNIMDRRRRWEKAIEDTEMLMETLETVEEIPDILRLKGELKERILEFKSNLEKTPLDNQFEKKKRTQANIEKLLHRRQFAHALNEVLYYADKELHSKPSDNGQKGGTMKLGDVMPENVKKLGEPRGNKNQ